MLDLTQRDQVAAQFGVASAQIERDHVLSLLLAVLAQRFADDVIFFGGTALARSHLPQGRLSEDLDLIAVGSRRELAERLDLTLPRALLRDYGRLTWQPALSPIRDTEPASLVNGEGLVVKVQLLKSAGYPPWPTELRSLDQRYRDVAPAALRVPTLPAFAAWKTAAWCDRHAPRDLWDLWALARIGAIDEEAADLYRRFGPTRTPQDIDFRTPPEQDEWTTQLGQQTRLNVSAQEALAVVRRRWAAVTGAEQG
ncbi:MAG TPA: nucleotidyl transferase AbiEii/AbiGii toxin family protein [Pseudonocardiaceae bacterium]|jgi:predicted nucleotidyltransferase component of viral defense system|nr:nucleotidyl transferase AbiEii/AbiGii toxin family protein [Pseudonocardiaceae bacterium]